MLHPTHQLIDLIWVSLPFCVLAAINTEVFLFQNASIFKDEWSFLGILFLTAITLGLNVTAFVYRSTWGLDLLNSLLSILFIGIFAFVLLIYKAFTSSVRKAVSSLILVLLLFGGIIQLSISARAIGSNGKPENEIFWNGYFEGGDIVAEIIDSTKNNLKGTTGRLNVFFDGEVKPVQVWSAISENIYFRKGDLNSIFPEVVISGDQTIGFKENNFQGQEFISNSYPLWTWDPVRSFFSTDYWNWFFFRNNLQYKEYNFIWTNKTLINKKINFGAN
jgi:hypothetical protein